MRLRRTGIAPDGLRFELGLRSDAPPLAAYGPWEARMSGGWARRIIRCRLTPAHTVSR